MTEDGAETLEQAITSPSEWWQPPNGSMPPPPVETKPAVLPLGALGWPDIERLFVRLLLRVEDLDFGKLHGRSGQKQNGIDAFGRLATLLTSDHADRAYVTLQSRRVQSLTATDLRAAVDAFRDGVWAARTRKFYYATSHSLNDAALDEAIVDASAKLAADGITFVPWGGEQISEELRRNPDIVDDFFGREWVRVFCGADEAQHLGLRLSRADVSTLRQGLGRLYRSVFGAHESRRSDWREVEPPSAASRFVLVDVVRESSSHDDIVEERGTRLLDTPFGASESEDEGGAVLYRAGFTKSRRRASVRPRRLGRIPERFSRTPADEWLIEDRLSLLVAAPGAGKSSLLKFVAMSLVSESPQPTSLTQAYGTRLPVWLPFGFLCRHIAESTSNSLLSAVRAWLESQDAGDLWTLVQESLDDARLLLLVDGLDEWPDVPHAEDALGLIEAFLNGRPEAVAVVSCRPYALTRLPIALPWHRAHLAPLTDDQQLKIACQTLMTADPQDDDAVGDIEASWRRAASQAQSLIAEISGVPQLGELARVPLFLVLLASVWRGEPLPPRRFDVYRRLVELLLLKHPQMRRRSSRAAGASSPISSESAQLVFGAVAYSLRCEDVAGVVTRPVLRQVIVAALRDESILGYDQGTAHGVADRVLELGEEELGLLVSHGAGTVGFLHRLIYEELAGEHLATLSLEAQLQVIKRVSGDPGWHDVLLAMLTALRRPTDVRALLDGAIDAWPEDSAEAMSAWELLAASISAGVRIAPSELRVYLGRLAERIEDHPWMEHRARLLSALTLALLLPQADELLRPTMKRWMRAPSIGASAAIWALRDIPIAADRLWKLLRWGLQHSEAEVQVNAAAVIAHRATDLGDRAPELASLVTLAASTSTQAAALYALIRGWPDHSQCAELIAWAREQRSFPLRVVALQSIMGVDQEPDLGSISSDEQGWLLRLLEVDDLGSDLWMRIANELVQCVARGDTRVADDCLHTLRTNDTSRNRSLAWYLACTAFPDDPRFRDWAASEFETSDHPLLLYNAGLIPEAWLSGEQRLATAVGAYLQRSKSRILPQNTYQLSRLAVSREIRDVLIGELDSGWPWWIARALLRDYPQDADVLKAIADRLRRGGDPASRLAPFAVEILGVETALPLLVKLVDGSRTSVSGYAAGALADAWALCNAAQDPELRIRAASPTRAAADPTTLGRLLAQYNSTLLAERCVDATSARWDSASDQILLAWPNEPSAMRRARELLDDENPRVATIVLAYAESDDDTARELMDAAVSFLGSLEPELREVVATVLQRPEFHPLLVSDVLEDWVRDDDPNVRRLAVMALASALDARRDSTLTVAELDDADSRRTVFMTRVREQLQAYGPESELRRQAAWIAMLMFGDLHLMDGVIETIGDPDPVCVSLQDIFGIADPVLVDLVARHWSELVDYFGTQLEHRLSGRRSDRIRPWGALATIAGRYQQVADAIRAAIVDQPQVADDRRIVTWIVRNDADAPALDRALAVLLKHQTNDVPTIMNLILNTPWRMSADDIMRHMLAAVWPRMAWPETIEEGLLWRAAGRWSVPLFVQWFPAHPLTRRMYDELNESFRERDAAVHLSWEDTVAIAIMAAPAADIPLLLLRVHNTIIARDGYLYRPLFLSCVHRRLRADTDAAEAVRVQAFSRELEFTQRPDCHVLAGAESRLAPSGPEVTTAGRAYFFGRLLQVFNLRTETVRMGVNEILATTDRRTIITDPITGEESSIWLATLEIASSATNM